MHRSQRSSHCTRKRDSMMATCFKPLSAEDQSQLRKALLESHEMQSLNMDNASVLRFMNKKEDFYLLLKTKIKLCLVECNWHKKDDIIEAKLIANKRKLLLEILEFYGQKKFKSLDLLKESFRLLWLNLFRALPDPNSIRTSPNDDEMDFREPSWDHLVLIYEIAFHVVTNTEIDKKIMQKQLKGKFLQNLVNLFKSLDDREPQYVKIILHAIYGRFMALRKDIRCYLSQYCYEYIYSTKCEVYDSNTSITWQGIPEILAIFCSIIQGLNVPVKQDYHLLLRNVLVPLHKTYHLDAFHEELVQCCTQFIIKDSHSTCVILGGMLKFWPTMSPLKEQLFIDEIVHLLNASADYIEMSCSQTRDREFENIVIAVIHRLCKCMFSDHHQVAERALLIWKEECLKLCLEVYGDKCWSIVYNTLKKMTDKYWLLEIRNIARSVINDLQHTNPQFFNNSYVIKARLDRSKKSDEKSKRKEREYRWKKVKQLAIQQIAISK